VTLRENNLKELEGGHILWSQGALIANRRALKERPGLLEVVHELIERFEAHLKAGNFYNVLANIRGDTAEEVTTIQTGFQLSCYARCAACHCQRLLRFDTVVVPCQSCCAARGLHYHESRAYS